MDWAVRAARPTGRFKLRVGFWVSVGARFEDLEGWGGSCGLGVVLAGWEVVLELFENEVEDEDGSGVFVAERAWSDVVAVVDGGGVGATEWDVEEPERADEMAELMGGLASAFPVENGVDR